MTGNRINVSDDARQAVLLVAALFLIYNLNLRAIGSGDTLYVQYAALSIAAHADIDLNEYLPAGVEPAAIAARTELYHGPCDTPCAIARGLANRSLQERDGRVYSNYPVMASLVAAPAYLVALWTGFVDAGEVDMFRLNAVGKLTASALTAAACGVLLLVLKRWNPSAPNESIAFAAGLATPLWSTASQSLWSHAPAVLCLGIAFLSLSATKQRWRLLAAGVAMGVATACRPLSALFVVSAIIGLALEDRSVRARSVWIAAGAALVLAPLGLFHMLVFGTPVGGLALLESADTHAQWHGIDGPFSAALLQGLSGVLLSPSRGLFVYTPIVVVSVVGALMIWRTAPIERWILIIPVIGFILVWSSLAVWWGGHSYGPGFAADLVVPLALLAAVACARWPNISRARWAAVPITLLLLWSVSVQVIGAFFHPNGDWNTRPANVDWAHSRLWDWRDSQIVREIKAGPFVRHLEPLKDAISR